VGSCRPEPLSASLCGRPQCNGDNGVPAEGHGCCADKSPPEKGHRRENGGVPEKIRGAGCGCKSAPSRPDNPEKRVTNADNEAASAANQNGLITEEKQTAESGKLCNGCPDKASAVLRVTDINIQNKPEIQSMEMLSQNLTQDVEMQGGSSKCLKYYAESFF
jgi:hypothetical protein